jgi:hypothetical protein
MAEKQALNAGNERMLYKWAAKAANHDGHHALWRWKKNWKAECLYFSEKSAAVVFENWKVFCFVIGDVFDIPPE